MTRLTDYYIEKQSIAKVVKTERLTPLEKEEIREISLEIQGDDFPCTVNQSFGVAIEANGEYGNTVHHRLYSV
ncbi:MAG: ferredoxin-NADP reductase, partial [Bacteroidia bacterium]|nr:ferredoxin-NADP reductase [Bacteroidia bacterium]